ncbi:FliH/SctL family protein [Sphingomonas sp. GlSt437]|uniref:FliH/SctL family protein n=1 Tax=Sphingomonas sp. GlSt437 TaxID=3389970 RepID=UPI003A89CF63
MSEFTAGFASRLDAAARALALSYAQAEDGFAPRSLKARAAGRARAEADGPVSFAPQPVAPRFRKDDSDENTDRAMHPGSFADPMTSARSTGYNDGFRDGYEQARLEQQRDEALLGDLAQALNAGIRVDRDLIAARLRQTVLFLVSKLIGEAGIEPDLLARRIGAAVDLVADSAETVQVRLHPDDIALLPADMPAMVQPLADETMARGAFVIDAGGTIVEDGPDIWLEQLAQAIDRVGVPPIC